MLSLRPITPEDIDLLLNWENDPAVWPVSGTVRPFTREQIAQFVENQQLGFAANGQLRLIIEVEGRPVGALDLFDYDATDRSAGVGILIANSEDRRKGYAAKALQLLEDDILRSASGLLRMTDTGLLGTTEVQKLWCRIQTDNPASLALFRKSGFTPRENSTPEESAPTVVCWAKDLSCATAHR